MEDIQINRVYDEYRKTDFTPSSDNLNPLRELSAASLANTEVIQKIQMELYAKYKARLNELLLKQGREDETIRNTPSDLGLPFDYKNTSSIYPPFGNIPDRTPRDLRDVELLELMNLLEFALGGVPVTLDDLPFDICGDRKGETTGTPINLSVGTEGISKESNSDVECLLIELEFLKLIFMLLGFLQKIMAIERTVLAILFPIIDLVVKVLEAIFNPSKRARLLFELAGILISMIISYLSKLINKLLSELNLECLISSSLSGIRAIMGTVSSAVDTGSQWKDFLSFSKEKKIVKREIDRFKDIFAEQERTDDSVVTNVNDFEPQVKELTVGSGKIVQDYFVGKFTVF